nr:reverse transcriptase domain-containing protein [Tanacetum cinerariifolium]
SFNRITSTLKFKDEPKDAIKLMLFPFSLDEAAEIWYEKEPPRSILTWGDLEKFREAWKRFKEMLRQCPHHGFSELHQINTFYNGLNKHEQDSLNAAAGGNLLRKTALDALTIIENKSKVHYSRNKLVAFKVSITSSGSSSSTDARIDKLTDTISNLVETFNKKMTTPATMKAVKETCVICGGAHPYSDCIATDSIISSACAAAGTYNQENTKFCPQVATNYHANQISPPDFHPVQNYQNRYNQNQNQSYNQNRGNNYQAPIQHPQVKLSNEFLKYEQITETRSGSLPSNTIANPRGDLKAITTQSGVSYDGPPIPSPISSLPKVVEWVLEVIKETVQPNVYGKELTLRIDNEAITFKVGQTLKYSYNDAESINQIDVIDVACEGYVQEVLGFFDNSTSGNPTLISDPIIALSSYSLTQFEGGDFIFKEMEACLTSKSIPPGIDDIDFDLEGDIHLLEELLNNDPSSSSLPPKELNVEEIKTVKSSIDEPPELELKELSSHLEYAFLEGTDKLPVIISKQLKDEEKSVLLKVLKSHKRSIT